MQNGSTLRKLDESNTRPTVMLNKQVSGVLFGYDLAAGIIISTGLRRAMNTGILQRMEAEDKHREDRDNNV
jgi:hypothetical protein